MSPRFNILAIGQGGRLEYEAVLLAASLRHSDPGFSGTLFIAEPQPGPKWQDDPRMSERARKTLTSLGAQILPFETRAFGTDYPHTIGDMPGCLARVDALAGGVRDKVRGRNAQRIFGF